MVKSDNEGIIPEDLEKENIFIYIRRLYCDKFGVYGNFALMAPFIRTLNNVPSADISVALQMYVCRL